MKPRLSRAAALAGALLLPLAFTPLVVSIEDTGDHLRDGKARAFAEIATDAHHQLDAAKQAHLDLAMEEAELFADEEAPAAAECTGGFAGPYPCENVHLASVVSLAELGGAAGNDSWGWTDPESEREFALMGTGTGVAFVEITEPTEPVIVGRVETHTVDRRALWRDVKVDDHYAFIVSENNGHGMQVFDLHRLLDAAPGTTFVPDAHYDGFGNAHNIFVNGDTDTAYAVGTNTCNAGLHMVDISDPLDPQPYFSKGEHVRDGKGKPEATPCYASDGYTHDVHCVIYNGPDPHHRGDEICAAANEDSVTVVRIEEGEQPELLTKIGYDTAGYTHQGRFTPDHRFFVFNDELDEDPVLGFGTVDNTTTYMVDLVDLDLGFVKGAGGESRSGISDSNETHGAIYEHPETEETLVKAYSHETISIDHNLEITGNLIWQANYNVGLRVLSYTEEGLQNGELNPVGFFDVDPGVDVKAYGDSWNVYPYFPSGTVIVSNLGQGLLVLTPDRDAMGFEPYEPEAPGKSGEKDNGKGKGRP